MSAYIPESLRDRIAQSDRQRCCYCLTSEANSGIPMTFDHIQPISKGGELKNIKPWQGKLKIP